MLFDRSFSVSPEEHVQYAGLASMRGYLGAIEHSDVPYMYHHLRKGCVLNLEHMTELNNSCPVFNVRYGSYRVGTLNSTMSRKVEQLQINGLIYRITIVEIIREKYMPPTAIIVDLQSATRCNADAA